MKESYENSVEELKRADHLFYVSLKYTRTVDMIKHVIERLVACFEFGTDSILEYAKENKKIDSIPTNFALKCESLQKIYPGDEDLDEFIYFVFYLRKLLRSSYKKREEFRRHVTMIASINNGEIVEVNIDLLKEFYGKTKEFVNFVKQKIGILPNG
tara:strand:+ start:811 stop:1278 length:468 start_codon:yes stop_codon:yes gene_type:complete